jgi:hypothetical protein
MLKKLLKYLWQNEDGFFGIDEGPSSQEIAAAGQLGQIGNFATSTGEANINASDEFFRSILSGDPGQISKVLGPAMSSINKQAEQSKLTTAEFGNRGGGTNSRTATAGDTARSSIDSLVGNLTGTAASTLGTTGQNLLSTGESATSADFSAQTQIQKQKAAKWNDIFSSIASVAGAVAGIPGLGGAAATFGGG